MTEQTNPGATPVTPQISAGRIASGATLYISGQIALDANYHALHPGNAEAQADVVFAQIGEILAGHGCTFDDVVKLTTFVVDIRDLGAIRAARSRVFTGVQPAATTVAVSALARPGLLVEIDAIAALPAPAATAPQT